MNNLEDVDKSIFHYINKVSTDSSNYFNRILLENDFNIDFKGWVFLSHVIEHPGENQKWYGENIFKDKTTTMRLIDALEKKQLIKRVPDKTDRRYNLLYATEEGELLIKRTIELIKDIFQLLFSGIKNEQMITTISVLKKIIENIYSQNK